MIYPGDTVDVSIVLIDACKTEMQQSIRKSGVEATNKAANDRVELEWCPMKPDWTRQLSGDQHADFEILLKMWSIAITEKWKSDKHSINVRFHNHRAKQDKLDDIFCTNSIEDELESSDDIPRMISVGSSEAESSQETKSSSSPGSHSALLERLKLACEELASDKHLLEAQLEQSAQEIEKFKKQAKRVNFERSRSASIDKALQCPRCNVEFSPDPLSQRVPMSSQCCEHSVCRRCLPKQNASLFLALVTTCDPTFGACSRIHHACPICKSPGAFERPNVNEGLCTILKTLKQ